MIVSIETQDSNNIQPGYSGKRLVISYIGKSHNVEFLTYDIPAEQMFQWRYAKKIDTADPIWQSWDWKPVFRDYNTKFLSDSRVKEIIMDMQDKWPETREINNLYDPDTYYTDIEVDVTDDGFPDAEHARNPINTISWVHNNEVVVLGRKSITDNDCKWIQEQINEHCKQFDTKYIFKYEYWAEEVDLINRYFNYYIAPATCVTGWNYFGYDYPYLYNRAELLGIDKSCLSPTNSWYKYKPWKGHGEPITLPKHKLMFDYMEIFDKWDRTIDPKENTKLDWVSEKVLGTKKVVHQLGFKQEWEQNPVEYIFYNAVDSILVRELDLSLKTSAAFYGLANLMHIPALNAFSPVRSIESVQVEYLYKEHRVMPSSKKTEVPKSDYEGAFVYKPIPGIYKNVLCLDYSSLYPTTIRQFNISPDTLICKDKNHTRQSNEISTTSGAIFRRDVEGFIPKILDDYFAKRKEYKNEMLIAYEERMELEHIYEHRFKTILEE